jgi:DNA-binding transcriptional LysR family regulator
MPRNSPHPANRRQNEIATKLAAHEMRMVASPHYLDKFGRPNSIAALAGHRLLDKLHGSDALGWSRVLGKANQQLAGVRDVFRCDDFEALREAALSGFGIALLPSWVVGQDIAAGSLRRVLAAAVAAGGETGGIYVLRALAEPPAKVTAFIASLRTVVGSPPVWDTVNTKRSHPARKDEAGYRASVNVP